MALSRHLFLFGRPRFVENGQTYTLTYRKGQALFAYLAVRGGSHSREVLSTLLWPEYSQNRARANLRRTLYAINQAELGSWLRTEAATIAISDSFPTTVDVCQFQELNDRWMEHAHNDINRCGHCLDLFRQAIDLYTADFMADFYLHDSNAFEEWAAIQRERLRQSYMSALDGLTNYYLSTGDHNSAQVTAREQIEKDDLYENGYRQLMLAMVLGGHRSGALQVYEDLEIRLQKELAVEPDNYTTKLADQIRQGKFESGSTDNIISLLPGTGETLPRNALQTPRPISESPYRGLNAFREQDADLFFGR